MTVLRQDTIANKLFTIFVSVVVAINYINFGCALEIDVVKKVLKRPIGPAVGFACQFIVMPLVRKICKLSRIELIFKVFGLSSWTHAEQISGKGKTLEHSTVKAIFLPDCQEGREFEANLDI